ncbi:AraC family transcriptional regulator [Vallitalea okinawensis]|uniref:AraC family transcriptional regulator n=1 Tax=Vallitalea okinawensis TaxID=2078660 RepID=UPI000CFAB30C|nr:AraC family transcriptional regulator [Vallitalea okinawensis]
MCEYHEILDFKGAKARLSYSDNSQLHFPAHWHEEVELFYICEGISHIHVSQTDYCLRPDDLLIIGSKAIHAIDDQQNNRKIMLQFHPSLFNCVLNDPDISKFIYNFYYSTQKYNIDTTPLLTFFEGLKTLDHRIQSPLLVQSKILELTHHLYKNYKDKCSSTHILNNPIIQQVEQFVANNYEAVITLDMIANEVNLSKYYFTRYFKEHKGITFGQYLREYRIKKALNYLIKTDIAVTEIAYTCGFDSIKTFNRIFKHYTSLSPTQYRGVLNR